MNETMAKTRKRLIVSGNVQEAGYRVFVKSIAKSMGITGFAKNLPDETVEIVCEGRPEILAKFLVAIDKKGDPVNPGEINVVAIKETPAPSEAKYDLFKVEYDGKLTPEERENNRDAREERIIVGASSLNGKIDGLGLKIDSMHTDMNTRFDHMAERYDLIATSLVKALEKMDRGFDRMDRNSTRMEKVMEQSRKEAAASNRELASAVKFMIRTFSRQPTGHRLRSR